MLIFLNFLKKIKQNCLACSNECKSGCTGPGPYQCFECARNKIYFKDVEAIINEKLNAFENQKQNEKLISFSKNSVPDGFGKSSSNLDVKKRKLKELMTLNNHMENSFVLNQMIKGYIEYLENKNNSSYDLKTDDMVFCVSDCPQEMPFKTKTNFCSEK